MSKASKAIDLHCQVRTEDFVRVHEAATGTLELAMYYTDLYNNQPTYRAVRLGKDDALRLRDQIDNTFPAESKPVAPGCEYSFDGIGNKLLRIEPVPGSEQLVLNVCDSDGKHHIVMDKAEATRLANRLYWEYLPKPPQVRDYQAAAAPNWNEQPGTLCNPVPGFTDPFEVCLVEDNTKVDINWDPEMSGLRINGKELDGLINHLQHCRHHLRRTVRVKEVPGLPNAPSFAPNAGYHVVMDMQGEPLAVLHTSKQLDEYLSTNKLRVAQ